MWTVQYIYLIEIPPLSKQTSGPIKNAFRFCIEWINRVYELLAFVSVIISKFTYLRMKCIANDFEEILGCNLSIPRVIPYKSYTIYQTNINDRWLLQVREITSHISWLKTYSYNYTKERKNSTNTYTLPLMANEKIWITLPHVISWVFIWLTGNYLKEFTDNWSALEDTLDKRVRYF